MLSAYLDESGTDADSTAFAVGGLLAPCHQWLRLATSWERVLLAEGIGSFHASDCANGGGEFRGWDIPRREHLFVRLVNIIKRYVGFRCWTVVVMDDYRNSRLGGDEKEQMPFGICALGCAAQLRLHAIRMSAKPLIPYTFDRGGYGSGRLFDAFRKMSDKQRGRGYQMGTLQIGERKRLMPLQAADLWCYELYRSFADQLSKTQIPPRKSYLELLKVAEAGDGGHLFTGEHLHQLIDHVILRPGVRLLLPTYKLPIKVEPGDIGPRRRRKTLR